jgi:LysR family transcriptional regulator, low CO2-responsive transcriptional regulator
MVNCIDKYLFNAETPMPNRLVRKLGTFRPLQVLKAVADHGSITAAAQALHLTQPTVSMQLAKLAEAVDAPLYEVIGRQLFLTEAGWLTVACADDILEAVERLDSAIGNLAGLKRGRIRFGVVTTAKYFLPHMLGPFCHQYPDIDIELNVGNRQHIINRLTANKDDLYVFSHPPESLDIVATEFLENPLVVIAPLDHPLTTRRNIPFAEIADYPFIVREPGSGTRHAIEMYFRQHERKLKEKMTIESNEAIKHAVMAGLGLGILSEHTLAQGDVQQLARLDIQGFPIVHHWYWVQLKGKKLSVAAEHFLNSINKPKV